ncbi:tetratricopeptide repeat protein [Chloroflexota bacterium]
MADDLTMAIKKHDEAIRLNPHYADRYSVVDYKIMLEYYEQAMDDIARVIRKIERYPHDAEAYYNRGNVYRGLGEWERAIEDYDKAIRLNPEYAEAYLFRGEVYKEQGKKAVAIADFEKLISLTDEPSLSWNAKYYIEELSK